MALAMFVMMIVLLLLGFPMMIPLIAGSLVGVIALFGDISKADFMIQQMLGGIRPASLIAVPMFMLAADIMTRGHSADRLIDMVMVFVRHIKGGLAVSTSTACALSGAVSGSTQATVVAVGGPLRPRMLKGGYKDSFVLALIVNSSDIAFLIPPSIGTIIYGVVSKSSIPELVVIRCNLSRLMRGAKCSPCKRFEAWEEVDYGTNQLGRIGGFSLHAGVAVNARERKKLERICRGGPAGISLALRYRRRDWT